MDTAGKSAAQLREQIAKADEELKDLKAQLAQAEAHEHAQKTEGASGSINGPGWKWPLKAEEYDRYGRQLILPNVGIQGQQRLKASKILIVGAGGLGCPAAAYIAGAGVGTLGIVDGDVVEPSNLHRQVAHSTFRVGMLKVDSLVAYCKGLNPLPEYIPHREHLTPQNAESIVGAYDLVLDCTDHPTSRYLISDACVLLRKPLVSASALRTDGQLIVLNCPPTPQGVVVVSPQPPSSAAGKPAAAAAAAASTPALPPCYRCVFPKPPPPESVVSCGEGGILGPVVGVMGVLQALEAIKIVAAGFHLPAVTAAAAAAPTPPPPTLLLFSGSAVGAPSFRSVRMRARRKDCFACGEGSAARLSLETLRSGSLDYVAFCGGMSGPVRVLEEAERVSASTYRELIAGGASHKGQDEAKPVLLDVREKELFDVGSIEGAVNIPYSRIQSSGRTRRPKSEDSDTSTELPDWIPAGLSGHAPIYVVCRVGNDSQLVAKQLKDLGLGRGGDRYIGDIKGGMRAWKQEVDSTLPFL
ncbi:molybdenum cofactor synthesis protein 3 [Diaporthe helianthi]|uniref:Adenylyltransferase and sulfurtransferase uba4 n=1 Tax=Diaporthe helianthi TaxID=158607 RepID=A0A2P5I6C4_DIAHE|nr:molybdenum cofactor synthesis protein 3 [Diaporthe helianthi]